RRLRPQTGLQGQRGRRACHHLRLARLFDREGRANDRLETHGRYRGGHRPPHHVASGTGLTIMPEYEIHAIKYASMDRKRSDNFLGHDPHDGPMPLDFFVWVVRGEAGTFVIDTGFDEPTAMRRNRKIWRPVAEGLKAVGV